MKKILFTLSLATATGLCMTGCSDYLESDYLFEERMTIESVFSDDEYSERWLARAYYFLGVDDMQEICSKKHMPFNFADDMYYGDGGYENWKQGVYDENGYDNNSKETWQAAYKGIRQVSIFLNNIDSNMDLTSEKRADMKGQAHFLRAYFYWMLIRMFGPVPIVPDEGVDYTLDYEDVTQPRNTYDECVNYIVSELEKAAPLLPLAERSPQDFIRPTRGAALALRARALLYAASPMYNGGAPAEVQASMVTRDGKPLLSSTYDDYKWARAAAAARDVMELDGKYTNGKRYELYHAGVRTATGDAASSIAYPTTLQPQPDPVNHFDEKKWPDGYMDIDPFESYRSVFNGQLEAHSNPELIYSRGQNQGGEGINIMILHQLPRRWGFGYNSHGMTQKQCDAYYMADGSDCPGMNSMYAGQPGYTDPLRYNTDSRPTDLVTEKDVEQGLYPELGPDPVGICKQYAGREPRFYASVAFNGSMWNFLNADTKNDDEKQNVRIWYYLGDLNGYKQTTYYPRTGISVKKWVHPDDIGNVIEAAYSGNLTSKVPTDIRFAEILLIYAEAINEVQGSYIVPTWDGKSSWTITRDVNELKRGMQPIRIRAGIPDLPEEIYQDVNKFRIKLKRERQIELFAESHRYFDLRRWCDADEEEPRHVYGCNIYCREDQYQLFHTPVETPSLPSIFTTKMWFWPIAHEELLLNMELSQNPGWTDAE